MAVTGYWLRAHLFCWWRQWLLMEGSPNVLMTAMIIDGCLTKPVVNDNGYRYIQPRIDCVTRCPSIASDLLLLYLWRKLIINYCNIFCLLQCLSIYLHHHLTFSTTYIDMLSPVSTAEAMDYYCVYCPECDTNLAKPTRLWCFVSLSYYISSRALTKSWKS